MKKKFVHRRVLILSVIEMQRKASFYIRFFSIRIPYQESIEDWEGLLYTIKNEERCRDWVALYSDRNIPTQQLCRGRETCFTFSLRLVKMENFVRQSKFV